MKRSASAKRPEKPETVDAYLAQVSEPARNSLQKVRAAVRSLAPKESIETISYGIPMFKYEGMLFAFAAFKNHCSLFPTSMAVAKSFESQLEGCEVSKRTTRFPVDKPPSASVIKKMVQARLAEKKSKH